MLLKCLFAAALLASTASSNPLDVRDTCKACNPSGVSGTNPPAVGSDLQSLYVNLLSSVKNIHFKKRWVDEPSLEQRDSGLCCAEGSECVKVDNLNIPMCYDKFTTNYKFSDGSYGSLTTGDYSAADGSKANLISGNYTKSGQTGDIYSSNQAAKPNTATLSIPPQWTGSGVGSAIPVTALGSLVVYTTTIPGTTITTPTTLSASTVSAGSSVITTIPPRTITAPTTIPPITTVVTSTPNGAAASPSSSSKGAAAKATVRSNVSFEMSIFSAFMYLIYAL